MGRPESVPAAIMSMSSRGHRSRKAAWRLPIRADTPQDAALLEEVYGSGVAPLPGNGHVTDCGDRLSHT